MEPGGAASAQGSDATADAYIHWDGQSSTTYFTDDGAGQVADFVWGYFGETLSSAGDVGGVDPGLYATGMKVDWDPLFGAEVIGIDYAPDIDQRFGGYLFDPSEDLLTIKCWGDPVGPWDDVLALCPVPAPEPNPIPRAVPVPVPAPVPGPVPDPQPNPVPELVPAAEPKSDPKPQPKPEPKKPACECTCEVKITEVTLEFLPGMIGIDSEPQLKVKYKLQEKSECKPKPQCGIKKRTETGTVTVRFAGKKRGTTVKIGPRYWPQVGLGHNQTPTSVTLVVKVKITCTDGTTCSGQDTKTISGAALAEALKRK
jgi:hypothetical protein